MNRKLLVISAATALVSLGGCGGGQQQGAAAVVAAASSDKSIDQSKVCQTNSWQVARDCKVGQKIAFLPESWGNEQLPVMFAAVNCDLRYSIAMTKGAVVCIFNPIKPDEPAAASAPAAAASN
ncbi:MAG: hypothetical protein JSR75_03985 [Proteobacteria bacterium]|nr:hypothetical protein [Pseudomonadota bacterium]